MKYGKEEGIYSLDGSRLGGSNDSLIISSYDVVNSFTCTAYAWDMEG
jgi:hypothetical protein